jgi:hypothetical protein
LVDPGDTVLVKDGVYFDSNTAKSIVYLQRDGTPDAWIAFRSYNLHGAVLDCQQGAGNTGFYLYFANYIEIEGFEIRDCNSQGIMLRSPHDVRIVRNLIHGIGRYWDDETCTAGGGRIPVGIGSRADVYNVLVARNAIFDVGRNHNATCGYSSFRWDHNIYATGRAWVIQNNLLHNAHSGWLLKIDGYDGALVPEPSHLVVNNTFAHAANPSVTGHVVYRRDHGDNAPHDVVFRNNVFYDPPGDHAIRAAINLDGTAIDHNVTSAQGIYGIYSSGSGTPTLANNEQGVALDDFGLRDAELHDFDLTPAATLLIDQGLEQDAPDEDYAGRPRPLLAGYDIGAYEYDPGSEGGGAAAGGAGAGGISGGGGTGPIPPAGQGGTAPAGDAASEEGGCSCAIPRGPAPSLWRLGLLAGLVSLVRHRRRVAS